MIEEGYSRAELEAAGLLDFRVFLIQVWAFLQIPAKDGGWADPTPVQLDISRNLQHAPRRFILQAFRGVGKSWITVAFVLWTLLLDPQKKIMVVSASQQLADDFSKFCKQLIHGIPILQHLAPRDGQRDSAISFDVGPATPSKDPSVKSVGITGQLTGSRADLIVGDDIEVVKNSYTALLRERLGELVKEFDAVLKPNGRVIYLGTPQIEDSLYNKLAKDRGYSICIWPAEIPARPDKYHGRLAPYVMAQIEKGAKPGTPIDPKRFDETDLAERRMSYGEAGYALQYMLDTSPSDAERHPLKLSDLMVADVDDEMANVKLVWGRDKQHMVQNLQSGGLDGDVYYAPVWKSLEMSKFQGTVMAIDPSGKGSDETGFAIVRYAHGRLYWVASGGYVDGFGEQTLRSLAIHAITHKVNTIVVEENFGGGMFAQLLKPQLVKVAEELKGFVPEVNPEDYNGWSKGQKELRILDVLEPLFKSHRIVVNRSVIEADIKQQYENARYSVVQQVTRMARIKGALPNDDRVDALAQACGYWTDRMNRDQDKILEKNRQEALEKSLKDFMRRTTGRTGTWGGPRYGGRRV